MFCKIRHLYEAAKSLSKRYSTYRDLEFPTQFLFWEPSSNGHRNGKHVPCRLSDKPIPPCTGYRNTCFQRDLSKLHHACTSGSFLNPGKWQRALFEWGQTSAVKRHSCGSPVLSLMSPANALIILNLKRA